MIHASHRIAPRHAQGFILVTSLVFLVVITLIAVSAISSSTLQERMASNLREKSRALHAADAALRHGERLLTDPVFNTPQAPGTKVTVTEPDQSGTNDKTIELRLWSKQGMLPSDQKSKSTAFLDPAVWADNDAMRFQVDPNMPDVKYYVEDYGCLARNLDPDDAATCSGGVVIYRITARAQGANPAAVAVTQSLYGKRY